MSGEGSDIHVCSCSHRYESGRTMSWAGTWRIHDRRPGSLELDISGRGSGLRVILGESSMGKYLFIPCLEKGCVLSWDLRDYLWNLEHLSRQINTTDAVTVISALRALGEYLRAPEEDESADITDDELSDGEEDSCGTSNRDLL